MIESFRYWLFLKREMRKECVTRIKLEIQFYLRDKDLEKSISRVKVYRKLLFGRPYCVKLYSNRAALIIGRRGSGIEDLESKLHTWMGYPVKVLVEDFEPFKD